MVLQYPKLMTFKARGVYTNPTEEIDLRNVSISVRPGWTDARIGPHGFELVTDSQTFAFRTPTLENKTIWIMALITAITRGRRADRGASSSNVTPSPIHPGPQSQPQPQSQSQSHPADESVSVEDALLQHVLRQSAIEAGVNPNETKVMSASTALRIEQDQEYKRTLEEDMRRERESQEELEGKANPKESKTGEEFNKISEETSTSDTKEEPQLPAEELKLGPEPQPGSDVCTCLVRLPSGKRLVRRFEATKTLKALHHYVRAVGDIDEEFVLVSNFPRKVWHDENVSLKDSKLGAKCSFFVEIQ